MVTVVNGNLMDATEDVIAHQTNCVGVMGSGVALYIKEKYPEVYARYRELCESTRCESLLGQLQICRTHDGKRVANVFGQLRYGTDRQHTDYDVLEKSLRLLAQTCEPTKWSIAMPYGIGCGRGGGDWNIVYSMIERIFSKCNVTLYKL